MNDPYQIVGLMTTQERQALVDALTRLGVPRDATWRFSILPDAMWYRFPELQWDYAIHVDPMANVVTIRVGILSSSDIDKILKEAVGKLPKLPPSISEQQQRVDDYLAHHQPQPQSDSAPQRQHERRRLDKKKCLRIRVTKQMAVELKIIADRERRTVNSQVAKVLHDFAHRHEASVSGIYPIHWKHHRPGVMLRPRVDQETLALLRSKTFRGTALSKYGAKILTQYLIEQSNAVGEHPARYSNEFFTERAWDLMKRRGLI